MTGGLFPEPGPADPDEVIAREEIGRYYADRLAEADAALTAAQDVYRTRLAEMERWADRGEITPDVVGRIDMAPGDIASHAWGRYHKACRPLLAQMRPAENGLVINTSPGAASLRAEAERLGEREKALRRWLTAQGHDLGPLAEPQPGRKDRR